MEYTKKITVYGDPKPQKRHRSVRVGRFTHQYDPSSSDKDDFLIVVQKERPQAPISSPVKVEIGFYFSRPKSHYRTGKRSNELKDGISDLHTSRPDLDNLCKFCLDALNGVFWKDDSCISYLSAIKAYSENPRTEIYIEVLN